jgi:hypothetical protein
MKETKKKQCRTFETSFACIGTSANCLAMLVLSKEESEVRQLNVEPLWKAMMEQMAFPDKQLINGQKWKTKQELLTLVETYYVEKVKELNHTIEEILEK